MTDLATIIERKGAKSKEYPADWDIIALRIKEIAKWRCERCHADFDPGLNISRKGNGFVLTVHHLDGNKKNCQQYNLAALCQRCHLRIQARVEFLRDTLDGIHSYWMSRHVKGYNVEARLYGKRELTLTEVELTGLYSYSNKNWRYSMLEDEKDITELAKWQDIPHDVSASHTAQLRFLLDSMDRHERPPASTVDVRPTLELITALYKSAATGSLVRKGSIGQDDPFYRHVAGRLS